MSDSADTSIFTDLKELESQERMKRRSLRRLLDEQRQRKNHAVGINSMMGSSRSFVTSVDLSWAADNIRFASELPIFNEYRDEHGFIKPDERTQDLIQQRKLDWRRQVPMTLYLAGRENHKFPPLLVVVTRPWVDQPDADQWGPQARALEDSLLYTPLDSNAEFVDLSFESGTGSILYAIDGQHRLMALRGLKDLVRDGHLHEKTDIGKEKAGRLEIDHIIAMSRHRIGRSDIHKLLDERIGIELIPAVMAGETRDEALRRLRTLFVHVNRNATPLPKGELALLDEDNGFAVVARMTRVRHPLLKNRVKISGGHHLSQNARHITTLETLTKISAGYLEHRFKGWKPHRFTPKVPLRPEWDELWKGKEELIKFFDALGELPSFDAVRHGTAASEFRRTSDKGGAAHLLFRPMAQSALAAALGHFLSDGAPSTAPYWAKMREADEDGRFRIDDPGLPWYGPAWDPVAKKMRRRVSDEKLVKGLFLHLLGGGTADEEVRERLRMAFAMSRIVTVDADEAIDLAGDSVRINQIRLPHPW